MQYVFTRMQYKDVANTHTSAGGLDRLWDTTYCLSQPDRNIATYICKLSVEKHFLDLDVNENVLLDIDLKELVRHMIVSTELKCVVFGCCGVVL